MYANVRSINNKLDELRLFISDKHYDIVSITESWLTPEILDCTVNLPNFVVNRDDRHTKIGGGVCVWLNSSISYDRFYPSIEKPCDIESVFLILKNYSIIFITVYIPPGLNMTKYNAINEFLIAAIDEVLSVLPELKVVLTTILIELRLITCAFTVTSTLLLWKLQEAMHVWTKSLCILI